jgi:hypothetical protein
MVHLGRRFCELPWMLYLRWSYEAAGFTWEVIVLEFPTSRGTRVPGDFGHDRLELGSIV